MQQNMNNPPMPETPGPAAGNMPQQQKPPKKKKKNTLLKVIIWLVVIALVIFLTLFLASKIGQFDSIMEMIRWIMDQGVDFSA